MNPRTWSAVATGAAAGLIVATAALWGWILLREDPRRPVPPVREVAQAVGLFRLPRGGEHELLLVPAGPDAMGEPALSRRLFPGEEPPRELASLLLANVSATEPWDVDLATTRLRCRARGDWEPMDGVAGAAEGRRAELTKPEELRLRGLGGTQTAARLEPGALRQFLVALPRSRKLADLTDVQWGDVTLVQDRFDLERLRRFRADPAALAAPGR